GPGRPAGRGQRRPPAGRRPAGLRWPGRMGSGWRRAGRRHRPVGQRPCLRIPVPGSPDRGRRLRGPDARPGAPARPGHPGRRHPAGRTIRRSAGPAARKGHLQGGYHRSGAASPPAGRSAGRGRTRLAGGRATLARAGQRIRQMTRSHDFKPMTARQYAVAVFCMGLIVVGSNILVQVPLNDWLTWGGLSYPVAFLVTDVLNRRFGPAAARRVAWVGFGAALVVSVWVASPRIAMASGLAYICAPLADIQVLDRHRERRWRHAPQLPGTVRAVLHTAAVLSEACAPTRTP